MEQNYPTNESFSVVVARWILPLAALKVIYDCFVYPAFFSSLRNIPCAHWSARYSNFWILERRWAQREVRTVFEAHQRLGPVVLLGPNEVHVNTYEGGIRTIYGGGFDKHWWYAKFFEWHGVPNMFTSLETKKHSERKRMIAHFYSKSYLHSSEDIKAISNVVIKDRFLPLINSNSQDAFDVMQVLAATAMDMITGYLVGLPSSSNFLQDEKDRSGWTTAYLSLRDRQIIFWAQQVRPFTEKIAKIGIHLVPAWFIAASAKLEEWSYDKHDKVVLRQMSVEDPEAGSNPIIVKALQQGLVKQTPRKDVRTSTAGHSETRTLIASEITDHLVAAQETSPITMFHLIYHLSRYPRLQVLLRDEIRSLGLPLDQLPSPRELDSLPLLCSLLAETLRLSTPVASPLPRVVPLEGCIVGPGSGIQYHIPQNTRISASAYSLHRNPEAYPSPLSWEPGRWIGDDELRASVYSAQGLDLSQINRPRDELLMKHYFWAFGSGGRMCIGYHFAMLQMKLMMSSIYLRYKVDVEPGQEHALEQADGFAAYPIRNELLVKLREWSSD